MKDFASWLGWVLMLVVLGAGLAFYNLAYVPQQQRAARQQQEIRMWMNEVQTLAGRLKELETQPEVPFFTAFTFDELFTGTESFTLTRAGEVALQQCVVKLRETKGTIEVTGHTDSGPVPEGLREKYPTNWEYGAAKAAAVVKSLVGWGVEQDRFIVRSGGSTRPRDDNSTAAGRQRNRRVEIVVHK